MTRAMLGMAIVAAHLAAAQVACSRPPDQVAHSPIPPLKQTSEQQASRAGPASSAPLTDPKVLLPASPPRQPDSGSASSQRTGGGVTDPEHLNLWTSPAMVEARQAVMDFSTRSAQTSPAEGQQFLARLSQLTPSEMSRWLEQFQARQRNALRSQEVERLGNRMAVEQAARRQSLTQQAGANAADLRSEATTPRVTPTPQPHTAHYRSVWGPGPFTLPLFYDPLEAVVDPMSPRGYRRRAAAAASLPGDLERGDPRNYIRGEERIDFGESANRTNSNSPIAPVAPVAPAVPPNDSAADQ